MRITLPQIAVGLLAAFTAAALGLQWQANQELRGELALLRGQSRQLHQLQLQRDELIAAQLPPAVMESMRSDHAAVERLRGEVTLMRNQLKQMEGR